MSLEAGDDYRSGIHSGCVVAQADVEAPNQGIFCNQRVTCAAEQFVTGDEFVSRELKVILRVPTWNDERIEWSHGEAVPQRVGMVVLQNTLLSKGLQKGSHSWEAFHHQA